MNTQQKIVLALGAAIVAALYFFGPTVDPNKKKNTPDTGGEAGVFSIEQYRELVEKGLSPARKAWVDSLAKLTAGAGRDEESHAPLHRLADFWMDSVPNPPLHYFYQAQLAELENTEKSLTFAAHSILGYLPFEREHDVQHWLAGRGKMLFEKALALNPANDSTIIGLGGCIMYGGTEGEAGNAMSGIMKVREVAERDSNNVFAQYMLGVGGVISKQYDRAVMRFEKVVKAQPDNMEAMFKLAETYELAGNKQKAAEWYEAINSRVSNPDLKAELEKRITALKAGEKN